VSNFQDYLPFYFVSRLLQNNISVSYRMNAPESGYITRGYSAVFTSKPLLICDNIVLRPSIWEPLIPEPKTSNALRAFEALDGHFAHSINSGLSYAIFDSEYQFLRPESAASGGRLYWDELDPEARGFEASGRQEMVARMDFPLVCIALSVDAFDRMPDGASEAFYDFMPMVRDLSNFLAGADGRPKGSWEPARTGEVLLRSGCVTKPGYERRGLMSALNRFVMLEARARAYRGIRVGVASPSVYRNWMKPPPGCRSSVVAYLDLWALELEDEEGNMVRPYINSGMERDGWLIWCDLTVKP
jgi:hypothetical protein